MANQGLIRWPGCEHVIYGAFTMNQGITPSTATIYCAPQDLQRLAHHGPLSFEYGSTRFQWNDCRLDCVTEDRDPDRGPVWALQIQDRRWKWMFGAISGNYNQRTTDGAAEFIIGTRRNPQELATLCLQAMGERSFDVRALPTDARPLINWDYANPARALDELCNQFGCLVTLKLNDRVVIERKGYGRGLSTNSGLVIETSQTLDPPEMPDSVIVAAAPTQVQMDFELEAIAVDTDGTIDLYNRMSYWPWKGNAKGPLFADPPFFNNITKGDDARDHAKQYLYKWYRIKTPFQLPRFPGERVAGRVTDLARVLPLLTTQLVRTPGRNVTDKGKKSGERFEADVAIDSSKTVARSRELPAMVFGVWYDDQETKTNRATKVDHSIDPTRETMKQQKAKGLYDRGFEIDAASGIVKFSDYVYKRNETTLEPEPAQLILRTTVNVRHPETMAFICYERERRNRGRRFGTVPRYDQKDELALQIVCDYFSAKNIKSTTTNEREVARFADHYLDAIEREYQIEDAQSVTYVGFGELDCDGAIAQVTWSIDGQGYARTRTSRNREELYAGPSYKERQIFARLQSSLKEGDRTPGAQQRKLMQNPISI